tara:strand:- start:355 stop:564 length:210 start_codon:yes stop_codon:yes gene_type:complete
MPIRKTIKVCIVIGTGQKGTCTFAETVNKIVPNKIKIIFLIKVSELLVGKILLSKIELFFINAPYLKSY